MTCRDDEFMEQHAIYNPSKYERVGERLERMQTDAAELCKEGYRASVMTAVENIIRDNKLDTFGK